MPTETLNVSPPRWEIVKREGWVDSVGTDGLVAHVTATARRSEYLAKARVDLQWALLSRNRNVDRIERIVVTGIALDVYEKAEWFYGSRWQWLEIRNGGTAKRIGLEGAGSPDWKRVELNVNLEVSPSNPYVEVVRDGGADMGFSPGGYCGVGTRNIALKVLYQYRGREAPPNYLTVYVRDLETGRPVAGASLYLYENGRLVKTAKTDVGGYAVMVVPEGSYRLVVDAFGYQKKEVLAEVPGQVTVELERFRVIPRVTIPEELIVGGIVIGAVAVGAYVLTRSPAVRAIGEAARVLVERKRR